MPARGTHRPSNEQASSNLAAHIGYWDPQGQDSCRSGGLVTRSLRATKRGRACWCLPSGRDRRRHTLHPGEDGGPLVGPPPRSTHGNPGGTACTSIAEVQAVPLTPRQGRLGDSGRSFRWEKFQTACGHCGVEHGPVCRVARPERCRRLWIDLSFSTSCSEAPGDASKYSNGVSSGELTTITPFGRLSLTSTCAPCLVTVTTVPPRPNALERRITAAVSVPMLAEAVKTYVTIASPPASRRIC